MMPCQTMIPPKASISRGEAYRRLMPTRSAGAPRNGASSQAILCVSRWVSCRTRSELAAGKSAFDAVCTSVMSSSLFGKFSSCLPPFQHGLWVEKRWTDVAPQRPLRSPASAPQPEIPMYRHGRKTCRSRACWPCASALQNFLAASAVIATIQWSDPLAIGPFAVQTASEFTLRLAR